MLPQDVKNSSLFDFLKLCLNFFQNLIFSFHQKPVNMKSFYWTNILFLNIDWTTRPVDWHILKTFLLDSSEPQLGTFKLPLNLFFSFDRQKLAWE